MLGFNPCRSFLVSEELGCLFPKGLAGAFCRITLVYKLCEKRDFWRFLPRRHLYKPKSQVRWKQKEKKAINDQDTHARRWHLHETISCFFLFCLQKMFGSLSLTGVFIVIVSFCSALNRQSTFTSWPVSTPTECKMLHLWITGGNVNFKLKQIPFQHVNAGLYFLLYIQGKNNCCSTPDTTERQIQINTYKRPQSTPPWHFSDLKMGGDHLLPSNNATSKRVFTCSNNFLNTLVVCWQVLALWLRGLSDSWIPRFLDSTSQH